MEAALEHLREIADALDHSDTEHASTLILEADESSRSRSLNTNAMMKAPSIRESPNFWPTATD